MFYCDVCAEDKGWPLTHDVGYSSYRNCEVCGKVAKCNDKWSGALPLYKAETTE